MEFPYKVTFSSNQLKPLVSEEKDKYLALASLIEIGEFIPDINTDKNYDLLPVAFNACVINRVNKNDDVIDTDTALAIYKQFINKPINLEHNRQKVIGVILAAGFSEFGTDKPLTEEEIKKTNAPFNITLGGVVWRIVNPKLASLIEETGDPESNNYLSVSASWELGFSEFAIAILDANSKDIDDAKIITDNKEIDKIKSNLKAFGGSGVFEEKRIVRKPYKTVLPLGVGFTEKPAAEVKGVATASNDMDGNVNPAVGQPTKTNEELETQKKLILDLYNKFKNGEISKEEIEKQTGCSFEDVENKYKIYQNNISQSSISNVNIERKESMKINSIQDFTDENLKQTKASEIAQFISDHLKTKSEEWEAVKKQTEAKLSTAEENSKKALEELTKVKDALAKLEQEKKDREQVDKFNSRMNEVNEAYELDDESRAAIIEEIKSLASDEQFDKWKKRASVLFKGFAKKKDDKTKNGDKSKNSKDDKGDDDQDDNQSNASKNGVIDKALENADKNNAGLPNSSTASEPNLKDKYKNAFGNEGFIIKK